MKRNLYLPMMCILFLALTTAALAARTHVHDRDATNPLSDTGKPATLVVGGDRLRIQIDGHQFSIPLAALAADTTLDFDFADPKVALGERQTAYGFSAAARGLYDVVAVSADRFRRVRYLNAGGQSILRISARGLICDRAGQGDAASFRCYVAIPESALQGESIVALAPIRTPIGDETGRAGASGGRGK